MKLRLERTYQVFQDLSPEAFAAFKEDIRLRGVLVPIEADETGLVLDGHQRTRAVLELEEEGVKVDYRVNIRPGLSEDDKFAHGVSMNMQRRQLSVLERRELAAELKRRFSWSNPKIAALLAVAPSTVLRWLEGMSDLPYEVAGADGKTYKSRVWGGVTAAARDIPAALEAAAVVGPRASTVDVKRARVLLRAARLQDGYTSSEALSASPEVELRVGAVAEAYADVVDGSVDLILTDPPYPQEFLEAWWDLARLAGRVLKPGGLLITYCGHRWFQECFNACASFLDYAWLGGMFFGGGGPQVHERRIFTGWRPILMFSQGAWDPVRWSKDCWYGEGAEKDVHPWQQSMGTFLELVEAYSERGELVFDPFLGSGTTAAAALSLGRRFLGGDIDEGTVAAAQRRLGY